MNTLTNQDRLQWLREIFTAAVAATVIGGAVALFSVIVARPVAEIKDLLTILAMVNTSVGVVIGFYFNKTTTDSQLARADKAVDAATTAKAETDQMLQEAHEGLGELLAASAPHVEATKGIGSERLQEAIGNAIRILGRR